MGKHIQRIRQKIKIIIRNDIIRFKYQQEDFLYEMNTGWYWMAPSDIAIKVADGVMEEEMKQDMEYIQQLMKRYQTEQEELSTYDGIRNVVLQGGELCQKKEQKNG